MERRSCASRVQTPSDGAFENVQEAVAKLERYCNSRRGCRWYWCVRRVGVSGQGAKCLFSEYAGELAYYHPKAKVTIVHGLTALMNDTYPAKFRNSLLDGVKNLGVDVILGDKISTSAVPEGGYLTSERGQRVRADLVVSISRSHDPW